MALTFEGLIAHNKRVSWVLLVVLSLFVTACCGAFSTALSGNSIDWVQPFVFGSSIGAAASMVGVFVSYFYGASIITAVSHAHEVTRADDPQLLNVVEEMAIAAGIPCPKVYLMDDDAPNAFATGRNPENALVCITTGLRDQLTRDELQGVIAHEIAHIKNYDILIMMLVGVFAGIIVLLADVFRRGIRFSSHSSSSSSSDRRSGGAHVIVFFILGLILSIIAPLIAKLLQLAISREREYLADATGVRFCRNPLALASALEKIARDTRELHFRNKATEHLYIMNPDPKHRNFRADQDSIWSTHPPISKRIMKLQQLAGSYGK